jgi:hypothetical protein
MRVPVIRKNVKFTPDSSRIVARYFMNGDQRTQNGKPNNDSGWKQVIDTLEQTLRELDDIGIFQAYFINIAKRSEE